MKVALKYRNKDSGRTVWHKDNITIKQAKEEAKQFMNNPNIDRIWTAVFDTWDWKVKEILKEVK